MRLGARETTWLAIAAAYAGMLAADLPGFLTVDSIMSLHEGHFHVRESFHPAIYGWLLGAFDSLVPGTALYVAVSGLLLFGGWLWLSRIAGPTSWLAPVAVVLAAITPNVLIYQGIVWKDVLFANSAVVGFIALAAAAKALEAGRRPWLALAFAAVLIGAAGLFRQNGMIVWPVAMLAVAWAARGRGGWRSLAWSAGWGAAMVATSFALSLTLLPQGPGKDVAIATGIKILQRYDLAGALAANPNLPLPAIEKADPAGAARLRTYGPHYFSPIRIDYLDDMPRKAGPRTPIPADAMQADWLRLVTHDTGAYLRMRLEVFRWTFLTPDIDRCLPVSVGVDGFPKQMAELGISQRWDARDQALVDYTGLFLRTPVMSHLAYAIVSAVLALALLIRRRAADVPIAAMQLAALGFTASFFAIALACDYRYLYFQDLAALTGLVYLAMDLRLRRPR